MGMIIKDPGGVTGTTLKLGALPSGGVRPVHESDPGGWAIFSSEATGEWSRLSPGDGVRPMHQEPGGGWMCLDPGVDYGQMDPGGL